MIASHGADPRVIILTSTGWILKWQLAGPQVIILNGMDPQGPLFLVRAGHEAIVVEPTDPQLIAPHGADPLVIILNGMVPQGPHFLVQVIK